jgi:hypothetical protein
MLVAVTDFGSVWRHRFGKDTGDPLRFARGVYYNTTGVEIDGAVRQRPMIPQLRGIRRTSSRAHDPSGIRVC